jgi:hypothetical protein
MAEVSDALRHYARCISDSQGHDDCSTEFSSLKSAQDDFESAVFRLRKRVSVGIASLTLDTSLHPGD